MSKDLENPASKDSGDGRAPKSLLVALKVLVALTVLGGAAGYWLGRRLSPRYDDSPAGQQSIQTHFGLAATGRSSSTPELSTPEGARLSPRLQEELAFWLRSIAEPRDRPQSIAGELAFIWYACGVHLYEYDVRSRAVRRSSSKRFHRLRQETPRPRLELLDALTFGIGGLQAYQIQKTGPRLVKWLKVGSGGSYGRSGFAKRLLLTVVAAASGVGIGFYLGYENNFNCRAPNVQELLHDPTFWLGVEQLVRDRNTWYLNYDIAADPCIDVTRGAGTLHQEFRGRPTIPGLIGLRDCD